MLATCIAASQLLLWACCEWPFAALFGSMLHTTDIAGPKQLLTSFRAPCDSWSAPWLTLLVLVVLLMPNSTMTCAAHVEQVGTAQGKLVYAPPEDKHDPPFLLEHHEVEGLDLTGGHGPLAAAQHTGFTAAGAHISVRSFQLLQGSNDPCHAELAISSAIKMQNSMIRQAACAGLDFLWQLALEAHHPRVAADAALALVQLNMRLRPALMQDQAAVRHKMIMCALLGATMRPALSSRCAQAWRMPASACPRGCNAKGLSVAAGDCCSSCLLRTSA